MNKAFVTGAQGFIGVHLVEALLKQGFAVRCLVRDKNHPRDLATLDVELVEGDICNPDSLLNPTAGVDYVFHLAGRTSAFTVEELMRTNAFVTSIVARSCAAHETPPVHIVVSSVSAAGPSGRGQIRTEDEEPAPISNYGQSKLAGEEAASEWAAQVPTTIIRPGIVFGERNRELLPMFYTIDRFHLHPHPNLHSMPLSVIYVKDLVDLILRAAIDGERIQAKSTDEKPSRKGYYFACANEYPSYATWGRMIGVALQRQPVIVLPLLPPVPWLVGRGSELVSRWQNRSNSLNTGKIREATVQSWACSPSSACSKLGFNAKRPLLDQLRATATWYRESRWL